jgi:glucans biosynthesis protein C
MHESLPHSADTARRERCYYIDWLRFFAVLGVFLVHVAEPFTPYGPLRNDPTSMAMTLFGGFLFLWIMPFFFFLAGAAASFALEARTALQFLQERFRRLIVPYVFGVLILIPPVWFITLLSRSQIQGSFLAYYPQFFKNLEFNGGLGFLHKIGGHLWFLPFLFLASAVTIPLFLYLRTPSGQTLISKVAVICGRFGLLTLFIIPVILIHLALRVGFVGHNNWQNLLYFLPFYVLGFVVFNDKRFEQMIERKTLTAMFVGIFCFAFLAVMYVLGFGEKLETNPSLSVLFVLYSVVRSLNIWAWILFVIGIGIKFLNRTNSFYGYAVEIILPFYILHYVVLRFVSFYIVRWHTGIAVKFFSLAFASLVMIVVLYEVFVRHLNIMRFLFGMKIRKPWCAGI